MTPTKAIIVAAGKGRRLMPYTDQMPKCLVPVGGRSILERQLDAFASHGVDEVVIIRGYLGHVLQERYAALSANHTVRFVENPDFETNNILQSLFCAEHEMSGPCLITYSDIVFTSSVVQALMAAEGDICLTIDRDFADIYVGRTDHPLSEGEVADLNPAGTVARVGKRSLPPEDAWGEFTGLMKVSATGAAWMRQAWSRLVEEYRGREEDPFVRAPHFRVAYLTDLLQHLINAGKPITPVAIHGQWREIDTVQDLQRATALLGSDDKEWK